jgi:hypothetical protein
MFHQTGLTKSCIVVAVYLVCVTLPAGCSGFEKDVTQVPEVAQAPTDTPVPTDKPAPPEVQVNVGESIELQPGESKLIQAMASGEGEMQYEWILLGVGDLEGDTSLPAIIYIAPESVEQGSTAGVSVIVRNEGGETAKGVSISFIAPTKELAEVPIEEPTPESKEATLTPPARGECTFPNMPFRDPIEGPPVDVEAMITSIDNCADNLPTASSIRLRGTYSGDLTNRELWVLVYPPDVNYYPQTSDACRGLSAQFADGQWLETIRLGRAGVPEAFHIVLVVTGADSPASEAFDAYLANGCAGNWGSVPVIPPGATELDSIIVHTQ